MKIKFKIRKNKEIELDAQLRLYKVFDYMQQEKSGIAIALYSKRESTGEYDELFVVATKSFGEFIGLPNVAYMDLNNCPYAEEFIKLGFAEDTGLNKQSGMCLYPLWQFKEDFLKSLGEENYKTYIEQYENDDADI